MAGLTQSMPAFFKNISSIQDTTNLSRIQENKVDKKLAITAKEYGTNSQAQLLVIESTFDRRSSTLFSDVVSCRGRAGDPLVCTHIVMPQKVGLQNLSSSLHSLCKCDECNTRKSLPGFLICRKSGPFVSPSTCFVEESKLGKGSWRDRSLPQYSHFRKKISLSKTAVHLHCFHAYLDSRTSKETQRVNESILESTGRIKSVGTDVVRPVNSIIEKQENGKNDWTTDDSTNLYRVEGWGSPYFLINPAGHVAVRPLGSSDGSDEVDIIEIVEALRRRNLQLPIVLRFPEIVRHRMQQLQDCFDTAISKYNYQRHFQGVFPVKCNHDRYLLEDIVKFGQDFKFGLEAGSKPELLIAISKLKGCSDALLICNGYKDRVYIQSVLLARQLGVNAIVVLEKMDELDMVIEASRTLGVKPLVGIRAKLSVKHGGHWGETSGDKGKFGLTVSEIVQVVYTLREERMLDCLQLLHFHIGSQIPSIAIIKEAMREASHIYCELALMGAPMEFIDVGGGLGIDYDGSKGQSTASTNYSMQNYANDVLAALIDACVLKGVSQPIVVSESGRALASHHSVLIFDVLSTSHHSKGSLLTNLGMSGKNASSYVKLTDIKGFLAQNTENGGNGLIASDQGAGEYLLSTFYQVLNTIDHTNFQEAYNDAKQFKLEAWSLFKLGCLSLEKRAEADALYEAICNKVVEYFKGRDFPDELQELNSSLAPVYHINLSVFRSAPDSWAIRQVFPIMPLQRLDEKPTIQASLADLTCDSDGKFDQFIGNNGDIGSVLPVHELQKGEIYYMGLFLGGVYQEIMGSAHNLFGRTNVIHVRVKPVNSLSKVDVTHNSRGVYTFEHVIKGQTMEDVMRTVQHVGEDMMEELRRETEEAVGSGCLSIEEAQTLLVNYKCSLGSYTYLSK